MNDYDERPPDCSDRECGDCHACAADARRRVRELEAKMEAAAAARLGTGEAMIPDTYGPDDTQPWSATHGTVPRDYIACETCGQDCADDHDVINTRVFCPRCARNEED